MPENVSKASSIKLIMHDILNDKSPYLISIGDSYNDVCMFEIADASYTFNNAKDDVKESADYCVDHVYECVQKEKKNMRKILLSDIDETLYFGDRENNKISMVDQEAIKRFQAAGHLFGVCTGRSYSGTMAALSHGSIDLDFLILSSGAIIIVSNQIIKEKLLTKEILNTVMNSIDLNRSGIMASINGNSYFTDYLNFTFQGAKKISNIQDIPETVFTNIAVTSKEEKIIIETKKKLEEALGDQIEVNRNELSLDISPKNCDKGTAIKELVEYLEISVENVYGIGDSYNDIPMFKAVKHSYTFNTSKELVKQAALYHVDSLAECIETILNSGTNNSPSL